MRNILLGLAACFLLAATARATTTYGDVVIALDMEPAGSNSHGYTEVAVLVQNRSKEKAHKVTLTLPQDSFVSGSDHVRSITRTAEVGPEKTVRIALWAPFFPPVAGSGLRVSIDGRNQDESLRLNLTSGYGGFMGRKPTSSSSGGPLVLVSSRVSPDFYSRAENVARTVANPGFDEFPAGGAGGPHGGMGGFPGGPPGKMAPPPPARPFPGGFKVMTHSQLVRVPVASWGTSWLGYSRYDGVVLTGEDLAGAPAALQTALWQYAETGGCLVVLGTATVPESWKKNHIEAAKVHYYFTGLGKCLTCDDAKYAEWSEQRWTMLLEGWSETASNPWNNLTSASEANGQFPVVLDTSIPVRGLFVLMILFTLTIGPLNLWFLGRKKKRIWMLWTVPVISLGTCLAVFGYMIAVEGWQGHLRTEGITILDENARRATSLGWTGVYAPLTPGDGLRFDPETEVVWQKGMDTIYYGRGRNTGNNASCTIDWTSDQHFASGWVSARVPSQFKLRKSEARRERLTVNKRPDGTLAAVNGLGADILQLWVADEKGQVYSAEDVKAGAQVTLTPDNALPAARPIPLPYRDLFQSSNWLTPKTVATNNSATARPTPMTKAAGGPAPAVPKAPAPVATGGPAKSPSRYLAPRTYVAVLDGAPFFEEPLRNAKTKQLRSTVLGILRDPDDAN